MVDVQGKNHLDELIFKMIQNILIRLETLKEFKQIRDENEATE